MSNFPPPPPPEPPNAGPPGMPDHQARQWAMLCHISAFAGAIVPIVGNIGGPLLFWLLKRNEHPLVEQNGREAVNFQISTTIYAAVSAILIIVVIGILMLIALAVFWLVMVIIASIRANDGREYRYPLTIRFIR